MKTLIVIPARFHSTRFPGKPLADLAGMPLVQHVWNRCCQAIERNDVIVATDDDRIATVARRFGARVELTSEDCLTGTDRVAEVAARVTADWYINVQGDEPFIAPADLASLLQATREVEDDIAAINAMTSIFEESDFRSSTVPKVVTDSHGVLLYMSRGSIPTDKQLGFATARRQVGIYAFRRQSLRAYHPRATRSPLEELEDIELLRLLESGAKIQMIEVNTPGPAVDTPHDLLRAESILASNRVTASEQVDPVQTGLRP